MAPSSSDCLRIENLVKSFTGADGSRREILSLPAFRLAANEHCAVRGESGSGKTTLLHLIAGLMTPDSGAIHVLGEDVCRLSEGARDRFRCRHVGYVQQSFNLLQGLSALDNVLLAMSFGRGADRARAQQLLDRVGLSSRTHHLPSQLSVGQQQRVAVARALANKPALILADEPTGSLDSANRDEVLALLREVAHECGSALLLVSHDEAVLRQFGRVEDFARLNLVGGGAAR